MSLNYINYLITELNKVKNELGIETELFISNEQMFIPDNMQPDNIYIVVKQLSSELSYNTKIQPVQLMVLSEQNNFENAQALLNKFTEKYNFKTEPINGDYVKQQYLTPVIVSNFNEISYGYRSLLYVSGTLSIMEGVMDVKDLEIDGVKVTPLSFGINYIMNGNTQQIGGDQISSTVKSTATISFSINIPILESFTFMEKIFEIINGDEDGNSDFALTFTMGETEFEYNVKLTAANITTAPDQVPGIILGFMV